MHAFPRASVLFLAGNSEQYGGPARLVLGHPICWLRLIAASGRRQRLARKWPLARGLRATTRCYP
eukprot:scaffold23856_cov106-Isochrysis_galbana.AAC.2